MRVLVTGASGFIGHYVIEELLKRDVEVVATSTNEEYVKKRSWYEKVNFISYNISDENDSNNLYEKFQQPERLIHLAWSGLPNYKSLTHIEYNLVSQIYFLKNLISNGLKDVTITGTCFEYGMQNGRLNEEMGVSPANPYAFAKNSLRVYLNFLNQEYPFSLKWVRLFYMYGEGQGQSSLYTQLKNAISEGQDSFNMSPGQQIRDFMSVIDVAQKLVKVAMQNEITGIINCSSDRPITVESFVNNCLKEMGANIKLNLGYYPYSELEPMEFWGDNTKLNSIK